MSVTKVVICTLTGKPCTYPLCRMKDYFTSVECPYGQVIIYKEKERDGRGSHR